MPYPIITPAYAKELIDPNKEKNENPVDYKVLISPAAVEYIFPLGQEQVLRTLMNTSESLVYHMASLKPELEAEYTEQAKELIEKNPILQYYWPLKTLTMSILQNRNYSIEKRMLLLNYCYKTAQGMLDQNKGELIPGFAAAFGNEAQHDEVMKYFESIQPNFALSLSDGIAFLRGLSRSDEWNSIMNDIYKNIGIPAEGVDTKFDKDHYLMMKKAYFEGYQGKEHYIEQVMVNYVWTYCLPFSDLRANIWENFIFFNILFNSIKVLLTCYTFDKDDKDQAFFDAMMAFSKVLGEAGPNIVKNVIDVNNKDGLNNNGDMAILAMS